MSIAIRTVVLALGLAAISLNGCKTAPPAGAGRGAGVQPVFSQALPHMNGYQIKTIGVEVTYAPGASSDPHTHPCAVIGYVLEGRIRTQVKGEAEAVYHAGQTFYEPPDGVHQVSANASTTEPARLLALFTCDHEAALSMPVETAVRAGHDKVAPGATRH
jgi:quercetin dioxygenase-like cupin family protein